MRFSFDDVQRFAAWSADRNPLHVNGEFARQTHFGEPVVHGVLTVLEAVRAAATEETHAFPVQTLDIEFRAAVVNGGSYDAFATREKDDLLVTLRAQGQPVLSVRAGTDAPGAVDIDGAPVDVSWIGGAAGATVRDVPAEHTLEELQHGIEVRGVYSMSVPLRDGDSLLSHTQERVLALCSYITGMEMPGLRSLFTRITVHFHGDAAGATELRYRARTVRFDRQFRLLDTSIEVATPDGRLIASGLLRSYVPFSPVAPDLVDLASRLTPAAERLRGKIALVVGGTRGLGAELTASLALAGYHVYASARNDDAARVQLHRDLAARGAQVDFVQGDAGEPAWCQSTLETILERHGRLDLLVLNACAPPITERVERDSNSRHADYLVRNVSLVQTPLSAFVSALDEAGGTVVYISSMAVEQPPSGWGSYVAVKQAGEGLVRTAAQERGRTCSLIVRPPSLRTSWSDTPARVAGSIPADWIASHVVNRLAEGWKPGVVDVLTEFPRFKTGRRDAAAGREPDFTIRLAATFTTDPIVPAIRFWMQELELNGRVETAPYGQVLQSLLDRGSVLNVKGRGINVVLLRLRDWLRELPAQQAGNIEFVGAYLRDTMRDFERALRAHRAQASSETLLVLCPSHGSQSSAESILVREVEVDVAAAATGVPGLTVVSARDYHRAYSVNDDDVHDPLRDHIAHIPYRDGYVCVLAAIVARHLHRRLAPVRKVVVVDCDNTLWRGVVGEVGAEGVEFDDGHRALHRVLDRLTRSGVLVCLCSKNEEADVWRVFDTRQEMLLRRESVVAAMINWLPKSQNLQTLAVRLNLGLDSFVFIDDNPVECAEVRAGCPGVLSIEWPQDAERAQRLLDHVWEFDAGFVTKEDETRTQLYREEFRRQELRSETLTFDDFISNLQLVVDVAPLAGEDLRRSAQLTLRTNQFNFTTIRREEGDLQALLATGRHDIRTVRVRDRFGDYGLVGLVIAERGEQAWTLDTFLLSCRVLGRGVEHRIVADLGQMAAAAGARAVKLRVETTKRNTPARAFLESIVPAEFSCRTERALDCDVPSEFLAAIRFKPCDGGDIVVEEDQTTAGAAGEADTSRVRRREQQIARAAFELASGAAIRDAAEGSSTHAGAAPLRTDASVAPRAAAFANEDIAAVVHEAFSKALRLPVDRVVAIDALESLGCDSLRIVEITVALSEKFAWLPSTLLFEHRSVSQIVREIARISIPEQVAVTPGGGDRSSSTHVTVAGEQAADIAVVGMHVRCAGANSPDELWDLLSRGGVAVKEVPPDRRHFLHALQDARPHWAGLLDDPGAFDPEFFGVSPREAEYMDPQLRLFLEVAWSALEDAGCAGEDQAETGVFAGVMYGDYGFRANLASEESQNPYRCWEGFSLANRLSQLLGFHGPSLAIDTACSSSGTALHLACAALKAGDCRVAVVGGINLILDPDRFASLGRLGILSLRGKCEPFGADADGTVLGEGAGVVILRPLHEALRRGDRIYGVIKGTGLSTGSGTVGFTAPNPQAQAKAIRRALEAARVDPRTISYVETHGTGTALGDPIEVRGLTLSYASAELADPTLTMAHRCRLGSIKPNIGHLEAGAGVLGLIKVLLQLQRRTLLPSVTSPRPNPQIPFAQGPFDVNRELAAWERPTAAVDGRSVPVPRRAGVSSFGVGGANAHVIVEESPDAPLLADNIARPVQLLALSARGKTSLQQHASRLRHHLEREDAPAVSDFCFSVNTGRKHFAQRAVIAASTRDELVLALGDLAEGRDPKGGVRGAVLSSTTPKVAFLFTGQGSQYAGMGRQLYDTQPVFRDALDRCAAIFDTLLERPLLEVLFASEEGSDAETLNQTGYTQPALFAFEYALAQLWLSWGVRPDVVMGHSVGEIAAMCIAGGVTLEDGLKLIAARGRLMQALPAGGVMTSVMADETRVLEAIAGWEDTVAIAAINAPGQVVISGAGTAVAAITERLTADGIKTKPLTVSHAFHSPLMKPMLAEYERVVREIAFVPPQVPFVSCVDGVLENEEVARPEYWLRQVMEPVRFAAGVATLVAEQTDMFVEIGPQPVLLGMARQCVPEDSGVEWLPSLRKSGESWVPLLGSLARLYVRGVEIDWKGFDAPYVRRRVSVPPYAFNQKQYWLKDLQRSGRTERHRPDVLPGSAVPLDSRLHEPAAQTYHLEWRDGGGEQTTQRSDSAHWVVLADRRGVGAELARLLGPDRTTLVFAGAAFEARSAREYCVNPAVAEEFERVWSVLGAHGSRRVVHLWSLDAPSTEQLTAATLNEAVERSLSSAVHVVRAVASAGASQPTVWLVTRGAVDGRACSSLDPVSLAQAPLWGLGRTVALEHAELWGGLIDISHADVRDAARALAHELTRGGNEDQVAISDSGRSVPRLVRSTSSQTRSVAFSGDATYLVTGGVGALGLHVARWLTANGVRRLVLTSRRGTLDAARREQIASLERQGVSVSVIATDVSNATEVDALLRDLASGPSPLRGIVHAAGVDATVPLRDMSSDDIRGVLAAKVAGAWLLHDRTRSLDLDLFLCFSSMASVLGSQGRAHYAAANAFLDALVHERRRLGLAATAINWGPWQGGGMATAHHLEQFERVGNRGLDPTDAMHALGAVLGNDDAQAVVADIDWDTFRPIYEARRARPILSDLFESRPQGNETTITATVAPWVEELRRIPEAGREAHLRTLLTGEVAATLGFDDVDGLPPDRSFYELGMDSLVMADLVGRLRQRVGMSCSALIFDHPNVRALAGRLLERLPLEVEEPAYAASGVGVGLAGGAPASGGSVANSGPVPALRRVTGYDPAAETEIFDFQTTAWPHRSTELIPARWRWMFVDSARRLGIEPRVWLYRDNGRIVGHTGSIAVRMKLGGEERRAGWLVDSMVLKEYRPQAIGSRLIADAHDDQPFSLSLGQTAEAREILFRLGWKQIAPLQIAQLVVRPANVLKGKLPAPAAWAAGLGMRASGAVRGLLRERPQLRVRQIDRFDAQHDRLWTAASRDMTCAVVRDASYLNWKYVDQPGQEFLRLELADEEGIKAVAVWMFREPDHQYRYRRAHLVDVVAPLSDGALLQDVIGTSCAEAARRGADALLCYHINPRLTAALRACGFSLRQPQRFFVLDPAPFGGAALEQVLSPENWFVTQGDSDIDRPW